MEKKKKKKKTIIVRTLARERGSLAQAVLLNTNCCMPKLFLNNIILGRILMLIMGIEIG